MKRKRAKLKVGDPVDVVAIDHSTDDHEGWRLPRDHMKVEPMTLRVRGFYMGKDKDTIKIAFAQCGEAYSTTWILPYKTIVSIKKN